MGCSMAIGVCSAIQANFFYQLNPLSKNYDSFELQLYQYWISFYRFSIVEALLSLIVAVPIAAWLLARTLVEGKEERVGAEETKAGE